MQLVQLYQDIILDHYKHPRGAGLREPFDGQSQQYNPSCGDEITLRVRLAGEKIADVSYEAVGCSISQAAASVLYEQVTDASVGEALKMFDAFASLMASRGQLEPDEDTLGDGIAFAGVSKYPARVKCALLGWAAFKAATVAALATDVKE
ncbi:MAG: Fe-S cluster assembly sulfur transfer protein SufU [Mycobacteriales bacterium]